PYVSGDLKSDAAVWFASFAKYDPDESGKDVSEKSFEPSVYMDAPVGMASVLRENNIPFDVIGSKNLRDYAGKALLLCNVASIRDEEMDAIEAYVQKGGSLFISGPIGHARLEKLLGVKQTGKTQHDFTYMDPTEEGKALFPGFTKLAPLTINRAQYTIEVTQPEGLTVLATRTLPYTPTGTDQFAAIHSNPPGIHTSEPCAVRRKVGQSTLLWTAAPIEATKPYMSRQVVRRMVETLIGEPCFRSNAPKFVEVIDWTKDGHEYFAVINEQEDTPVVPMSDLWVEIPGENRAACLLPDGTPLPTENREGRTRVLLPKLELFQIFEVK
ncbi:MAG: hypothetical protein PHY12_01255, partial [Eubacteriales bacterium]|nr:hypothetical protein [Eubacteriales bacterium]